MIDVYSQATIVLLKNDNCLIFTKILHKHELVYEKIVYNHYTSFSVEAKTKFVAFNILVNSVQNELKDISLKNQMTIFEETPPIKLYNVAERLSTTEVLNISQNISNILNEANECKVISIFNLYI